MLIITIFMCVLLIVVVIISCLYTRKMDKELDKAMLESKKHFSMFVLMNSWLEAKQQKKRMDTFLKEKGYHIIAIYGMHYIGERLFRELEGTQIQVLYGIDQNRDGCNCGLKLYRLDDELPAVDAIIVTTPLYFYTVRRILREKISVPVILINEVIEGMH